MEFAALLKEFADAVVAGDGRRFAGLFTEDGQYHDVFYGTFTGHDAIVDMLEGYFHRDGEDYNWELFDPVCDGETGYARWRFSFTGKSEQSRGRRVLMEGAGIFKLRDGRIASYEDIAKAGEALVQLGLPAEKLHRVLSKMTTQQNAKPEAGPHLKNYSGSPALPA